MLGLHVISWHKLKYQNRINHLMPTCSVCGKEVQPEATFCPSCGSSLQTTAPSVQRPIMQQPNVQVTQVQMPMSGEERMASMVKRMERVSYITAGAAGILLVIILLLLI